jgi:hypothetical protein
MILGGSSRGLKGELPVEEAPALKGDFRHTEPYIVLASSSPSACFMTAHVRSVQPEGFRWAPVSLRVAIALLRRHVRGIDPPDPRKWYPTMCACFPNVQLLDSDGPQRPQGDMRRGLRSSGFILLCL